MISEFTNSVDKFPEPGKRVVVVLFEENIITGGKCVIHPNHNGIVINLDTGGYAEFYYGWAYPKIEKFNCMIENETTLERCSFKCPSCK